MKMVKKGSLECVEVHLIRAVKEAMMLSKFLSLGILREILLYLLRKHEFIPLDVAVTFKIHAGKGKLGLSIDTAKSLRELYSLKCHKVILASAIEV
jgi:hypothetical protein